MTQIEDNLKTLGLRPAEIRVYLYMLVHGLSTPPQIACGTEIARSNCYHHLRQLRDKGLLSEQHRGKRIAYVASDPEALVAGIEHQRQAAKRLLPDLRALYAKQKNKPVIRFYDGWEQVKQIYLLALQAKKKEIHGMGSTELLATINDAFSRSFIKELRSRNIFLYDILPVSSRSGTAEWSKSILKGYYDAKFLPDQYADLGTSLLLWDDHLALISLTEPIFGTLITNASLASTFGIVLTVLCQRL